MSSAALLPLRKATALYNYTPDEEDELELHEGDVVCVTKEQDDGWCRGFVESDPIKHLGLFPSNYVRNVTQPPPSTISALPPSHLPPYRPVVTVKAPIARRAKASFDYLPREPDELPLRMGDVVVVLETLDDGWCRGYIASDSSHHEGLFPANYVDMQEDSWTTTSHLGNTASKSPTKPAPSKAYPALDHTTPLDDNESDDDDPHWRHKGKSINLTHGGSRALHPSAVEATEPRASLESMQEPADLKEQPLPEGESGYYDDRGNYVMADGGYYSPDGLYFPKILDPTTTPAGYYDADGYYITDSGYFDLQGHYHDNTTEATTTKPSKVNAAKTSIGSVVQLKQALKRAKANADAAQAARLEAETQMQMELEARRRSERAAAARVERERAHEAQTKVIQQTIQNQIQKQLAKSTPPPFAHQQHEVQPVEHIQRWYRSQTSRRRQHKQRDVAATRIQQCGRAYVTNRRKRRQVAAATSSRRVKAALASKPRPLTPQHAARRIQAHGRRYVARRRRQQHVPSTTPRIRGREASARRLQRFWHVYRCKQRLLVVVRHRRVKKTTKSIDAVKQQHSPVKRNRTNQAARTLQRFWHVYRCKQRLVYVLGTISQQKMRPTKAIVTSSWTQHHKAATRLQRFWHVYRGRARLRAAIALGRQKQKTAAAPATAKSQRPPPLTESTGMIPAFPSKAKATDKRHASFAHDQAARRVQRFWRVYLGRTHLRQVMAAVARKQPRPRHLPPKNTKATVPPPMRPPRLNSPASALHPSSSLLPIFTTDVAQISQLATLIANSVNVELSKRMRAHDLQLDRLVTSVTHLQKAIDKHNGSLERVFSNQDRPPPQDVKAVLGNAKLPSLLPKATYSNYVSNVVVAPPTTSTGLYYNSSPTKQLRSIKQLPSKLPQQTSSRASKLPVLRSPTKARTKWPSRKLK